MILVDTKQALFISYILSISCHTLRANKNLGVFCIVQQNTEHSVVFCTKFYAIQIPITPRHFKYFLKVSYVGFNFLILEPRPFFAFFKPLELRTKGLFPLCAICANVFFVSSSNFRNILHTNPTDCTQASNTEAVLSNKSANFFYVFKNAQQLMFSISLPANM